MNDTRASLRFPALLSLIMAASGLLAQEVSVRVPAGTPLPVQLGKHVPLKKGVPLECHLLYPGLRGEPIGDSGWQCSARQRHRAQY